MKKEQVKIGDLYRAKVSDKVVAVRIDAVHSGGGWNATNTATGKRIRVKSAQRLRGAVKGGQKEAEASQAAASGPKAEAKKAKGQKAPREKKPKRVSALDAAAQVLAKADKPMRAQELVSAMAEQGLWESPGGKTPHATLYAAMIREITAKGKEARFTKVDRGQFDFNGKAA